MAVYKEAFWIIEEIQKRSVRIYEDAMDFGVPIFSNTDAAVNLVKQMIEMYGPATVTTERYSTGATQKIVVKLIDEFGDGKEFMATFEYVHINSKYQKKYEHTGKKLHGYINVETSKN